MATTGSWRDQEKRLRPRLLLLSGDGFGTSACTTTFSSPVATCDLRLAACVTSQKMASETGNRTSDRQTAAEYDFVATKQQ